MSLPPENSIQPMSRAEWRAWLEENQARSKGVWLVTFKKATGKPRVEYAEAVEEALCFGWIDSKANRLDEERTLLWFSPRKAKTGWSRSNKERIERLLAEGKMTPAGLAKIEAAQADGSWSALDEIEALAVPQDLADALDSLPPAREKWEAFPRSVKRSILLWIGSAKTGATRSRRIAQTATLAQQGERANQ